MRALQVHAGPRALQALRAHGLQARHVRAVPAAAGGPKGLVLNPLDQYLFGTWLRAGPRPRPVHLLGASIGAWRMACACMPDPVQSLARMARDYLDQRYEHEPGRAPAPRHVSEVFGAALREQFGPHGAQVLCSPHYRLHVFTSRGRKLLHRHAAGGSALGLGLGHLGAFAANALSRRAMGAWWERVVFSDLRDPLPLRLDDYRTRRVALTPENLAPSLLASCSIPYWLEPVRDLPGAPAGAYWDGGITDYHLHLNYASIKDSPSGAPDDPAIVLYPHFQSRVVPGWLDKFLAHRHRASAGLSNLVVLSPRPEWIRSLPRGKLPDRSDFRHHGDDETARRRDWAVALRESERLRDEFAGWVEGGADVQVLPLR